VCRMRADMRHGVIIGAGHREVRPGSRRAATTGRSCGDAPPGTGRDLAGNAEQPAVMDE
jgi:hypothetical protein